MKHFTVFIGGLTDSRPTQLLHISSQTLSAERRQNITLTLFVVALKRVNKVHVDIQNNGVQPHQTETSALTQSSTKNSHLTFTS